MTHTYMCCTSFNKVCHLVWQNTLHCVLNITVSQCYCQYNLYDYVWTGLFINMRTPECLVWLQRDEQCRKNRTDKHSMKFWTFAVTLTTAIQSFLTLWTVMFHQPLLLGRKGSAVQYSHISITGALALTLTLKIANHVTLTLKLAKQSLCMTHQLTMMHHHIKFGYKRYSSSGDIVQTNMCWHFDRWIAAFFTPFQPIPWHPRKISYWTVQSPVRLTSCT